MMESCLAGAKSQRVGPVELGDVKRNLLDEFTALSKQSRSGNLQVYLRVRPFTEAESRESQDYVAIEGARTVLLRAPRSSQSNRQADKIPPQTAQRFTFSQVFGPDASQRKVFEGSARGLVRDVLHGQNCLLFTYGVTNAGKTFTFLGPEHDSGLLPRSLWLLFNSVQGRLHAGCPLKPHRCRDVSRLTPEQQRAESAAKLSLLRAVRENDKSSASARSTCLDASSLISDGSDDSVCDDDRLCLDVPPQIRFSIWVSFCEIYNGNIHDLLEQVPGGHVKRTALRLLQDVKGYSFIKDLKWVQVSSCEEAFNVVKIGRKSQSLASTRLNQQSNRSHSIFSIRILRLDADTAVPRFLGASELALCDLAGSERCSRTHTTGERLKEAGNINNSLLTLGKCISAMRSKPNAKFPHHVPFRESKLTHFLQLFFCGGGKVSMVVNINQTLSCLDETLNVLKFSALAQKAVLLNSRPASPDDDALRSAMDVPVPIDDADRRGNGWETTFELVLEQEEDSGEEATVLEAADDDDDAEETMEEEGKSDEEAAFRLVAEAQIRQEVCAEFMEIFKQMEKDYSERLEKEREILEERAKRRLEILRNLIGRTAQEEGQAAALLEGVLGLLGQDLHKIRADAQSVLLANQVESASAGKRRGDDEEEDDDDTEQQGGRRSAHGGRQDEAGGRLTAKAGRSGQCGAALSSRPRQTGGGAQAQSDKTLDKSQARAPELRPRQEADCAATGEGRSDAEVQEAEAIGVVGHGCSRACVPTSEFHRVLREKEKLIEDLERQTDALRRELECVKSQVWRRQENEEPKESPATLSEDMQTLHHSKLGCPSDHTKSKSVARKRKRCQVEGLLPSNNKRADLRNVAQEASSCAIQPPASILSGAGVLPHSLTMATKPKRERQKLHGKKEATPLLISPHPASAAADQKEKESHHVIIERQLRSKAARK